MPQELKPAALRPQFQSPNRGAIGVVDIRSGKFDVCESKLEDDHESRRHSAPHQIRRSARDRRRETGGARPFPRRHAVIYVANFPTKMLRSEDGIRTGQPHWYAYNDMLDGSCFEKPESLWDDPVPACDLSAISEAYKQARKYPPTDFLLINSECSNAQTP